MNRLSRFLLLIAAGNVFMPAATPADVPVCDLRLVPPGRYATAARPARPLSGDFNSDGRPDLAVPCEGTGNTPSAISLLFGRVGSGSAADVFAAADSIPVPGSPLALAYADVDGDGVRDLLSANFAGSSVAWLRGGADGGQSDGSFGPPAVIAVRPYPVAIAAADLDADGRLDLVTAHAGCPTGVVEVRFGTGGGAFTPPESLLAGCGPTALAIADLDSNGAPDLVVAFHGAGEVQVLLGQMSAGAPSGAFVPMAPLPAGTAPLDLVVEDLDANGRLDVATIGEWGASPGTAILYASEPAGPGISFGSPRLYASATGDRLAAADLDGDGDADLIGVSGDEVHLFHAELRGGGARDSFRLESTGPFPTSRPTGLVVHDFDLDGAVDVVITRELVPYVQFHRVAKRCVDGRGSPVGLWTPHGVAVCRAPGDQTGVVMAPDGSGGAFVAWRDARDPSDVDLYAQRVDADGRTLWAADGVQVCGSPGDQVRLSIVGDHAGGAYLAWEDRRDARRRIYAAHLGPDGVTGDGWPVDGRQMFDSVTVDVAEPFLASDGWGGFFVLASSTSPERFLRIIAQHAGAGGLPSPGWPRSGHVLTQSYFTTNVGFGATLHSVADGDSGDAYFSWVWSDSRCHHGSCYSWAESRLNRLKRDGSFRGIASAAVPAFGGWSLVSRNGESGALLLSPTTSGLDLRSVSRLGHLQWSSTVAPPAVTVGSARVCMGGSGGAFLSWIGTSSGFSDAYALGWSGPAGPGAGWTAAGLDLSPAPGHRAGLEMAPDGLGNAVVTWEDTRYGDRDILASAIAMQAGLFPGWPEGGASLCGAPGDQRSPVACALGGGRVLVAWEDLRDGGSDLYVQGLVADQPVAALASVAFIRATGRSVQIGWRLPAAGPRDWVVARSVGGGTWEIQGPATYGGDGLVAWEDGHAAGGTRLGYRLETVGDTREPVAGTEAWIETPAHGRLDLGLVGGSVVRASALEFAATWQGEDPARVECFDVRGRRVAAITIDRPELPGQRVRVEAAGWDSGTYWARLRQGSRSVVRRFVVLR